MDLSAFKVYDIRGIYPDQLNADFARKLAVAYRNRFNPGNIVIGHDSRQSSPELASALSEAFQSLGVEVMDLGLCGTEMVYFATGHYQKDGGIMITASHNPKEYNGFKLVTKEAVPVGYDSGLQDLKRLMEDDGLEVPAPSADSDGPEKGEEYSMMESGGAEKTKRYSMMESGGTEKTKRYSLMDHETRQQFLQWLVGHLDITIRPDLRIVANAGNGAAGPVLRELGERLSCKMDILFEQPDGNFPNGVPNPLLPECRDDTARTVISTGANLGVAFDGDFDRCFFFDENGRFIEGYYMVGLLARQMLARQPGARIVHDVRLLWNTVQMVKEAGGIPVASKTGHAFMKEKMRSTGALYGGEMSAHHYFRDFWSSDSGLIPFLLILELLGADPRPFSEQVDRAIMRYPVSGELNFTIAHEARMVMDRVERYFSGSEVRGRDTLDGLSMEFDRWRFNLRASNTEPLLRLNVESRSDRVLMEEKTDEIVALIREFE